MPIYEVTAQSGVLSQESKTRLAQAITTIHADETDAPGEFINVIFPEVPQGSIFTAGKPAPTIIVRGMVRAGRPESVRRSILQRINDALLEITDVSPMSVLLTVVDLPPSWAMEAGKLLPEPTKEAEAAWFADTAKRRSATADA